MFDKIQGLIAKEMLSPKTYALFDERINDKAKTNYSYEKVKSIWRRSKHSIAHIVINNDNTWKIIDRFINDSEISIKEKIWFLRDLGFDETYYPIIEKNSLKEMKCFIEENPNICDEEEIYCIKRDDTSLFDEFYSKEEILKISKKIDEIIKRVGIPFKDNEEEELRSALRVFEEISFIKYDLYSITKKGLKNDALHVACENLLGLIRGKTVCFGYSRIVREILSQIGIETQFVLAITHAWLQIKIGKKWYNVDYTWERDKISKRGYALPNMFKLDKEFKDSRKHKYKIKSQQHNCNIPLDKEIVKKLIEEKRGLWLPNTFKRLLKDFELLYDETKSKKYFIIQKAKKLLKLEEKLSIS